MKRRKAFRDNSSLIKDLGLLKKLFHLFRKDLGVFQKDLCIFGKLQGLFSCIKKFFQEECRLKYCFLIHLSNNRNKKIVMANKK